MLGVLIFWEEHIWRFFVTCVLEGLIGRSFRHPQMSARTPGIIATENSQLSRPSCCLLILHILQIHMYNLYNMLHIVSLPCPQSTHIMLLSEGTNLLKRKIFLNWCETLNEFDFSQAPPTEVIVKVGKPSCYEQWSDKAPCSTESQTEDE